MKDFIKKEITKIRKNIGSEKAIVPVSGGVDSAVTAKLAWEALSPEQLRVFTIDDGLRREGEPKWVVKVFKKMAIPVNIIKVQPEFFQALKGIVDGDGRRAVYSKMFGKVCGKVAKDFGTTYAFFGTNKLDLIETKFGAQKQHNAWQTMGIDPKKEFGFKTVEPIKTLFKEEIRELARTLGLLKEISERMPFPGPGLSIRIMNSVTPERVKLLKKATKIVEENLLPLKPFECFACLMSDLATSKRGGRGIFGQIVLIRSLDSKDSGQTGTPTWISKKIQERIVRQILSSLPQITRITFDLTPKPPGRINYI